MSIVAHLCMVILSQIPSAPPAAAPSGGGGGALGIDSVFDFVIKGGWPMIPIALCSLIALAIIVERFSVLRRNKVVPRGLVARIQEFAHDRQRALELCRSDRSPIATVMEAGIRNLDGSVERMEKQMEEAGQREAVGLRHRMRLLSALPQVATMLGLLGTVFGMIKTFQAIALSSEALGKTEMLAKGIFEAWTCTAAGLLVAIPVLIAYHALMGRIDALVADIDRAAQDWLEAQASRSTVRSTNLVEQRNHIAETAKPVAASA